MNLQTSSVLKPVSTSSQEIVFIDRGVEDFEFLAKGVRPGVEVHLLEADAMVQMTAVLSERKGLKAVHVVSHGAPGCLYLGEGELSLSTLGQYEAELRSWFAGYAEGEKPKLLLYGCNVAAGDAGEEFLSQVATLTGVISQASRVKVGAPQAGGGWQLNYGLSKVQPVDLFSVEVQQTYSAAFAPGELDTSFGNYSGQTYTEFFDDSSYKASLVSSITIDAAGNILAGGLSKGAFNNIDFALARYTSNGQLDTSFANGGIIITDFSADGYGLGDYSRSITIDALGNILLGGHVNSRETAQDFALARYTSDGQLDTAFGNSGKVITHFGGENSTSDDYGLSITTDATGNILLGGYTTSGASESNDYDFALARYTNNGQLDTSFGTGGKVTTDLFGKNELGKSIITDAVGNILVAGITYESNIRDVVLVRYTSNGQLDTTFGTDGKVAAGFSGNPNEEGDKITIDDTGNILIAGTDFNNSTGYDIALVRYTSDGQLDTSFGYGGKATTDFNGGYERANSITTDAAGNILVTGESNGDFTLIRYTSDGQLDTSFGTGGKFTKEYLFDNNGYSIETDAAGDIFVGGYSKLGLYSGYTTSLEGGFSIAKFKGSSDAPQVGIAWNKQTGVLSSLELDAVAATATLNSIGRTITDTNWALQTIGDIDGDGQDDILLSHSISGQNLVGYMTPGGQSIESEALIGRNVEDPNWSIVGTGDFNADGKTDIIWQNQAADQILAWYMDGQGNIEDEAIIGRDIGDSNWKVEAVADFGGDGKADMLLRNGTSGQIILWEMDGDTIIEESLFGREVSDINWVIEGARDFDNNSTMDVLLRNAAAEQTVLWNMADKNTIGSESMISNIPGTDSQIVF